MAEPPGSRQKRGKFDTVDGGCRTWPSRVAVKGDAGPCGLKGNAETQRNPTSGRFMSVSRILWRAVRGTAVEASAERGRIPCSARIDRLVVTLSSSCRVGWPSRHAMARDCLFVK